MQGIAALQQEGVETPAKTWAALDDYWHAKQHKDGGWSYDEGARNASTSGMTAGAVASLHLAAAFRDLRVSATMPAGEFKKMPTEFPRDAAIANGLANLSAAYNPDSKDYYFLYHLQRAMGGAGIWTLGKKELLDAIAEAMLKSQRPDGSWQGEFADPSISGDQSLVSTCYAMLTLSASFQPIAFSKLQYEGGENRWDGRPRDVANVTMWMSGKLPRPLRWQVISEATPEANDFASPVVFISGSKEFAISDAMVKRLRAFVEAGGMIVSLEEKIPEPETEKAPATAPATTPSAFTEAITKRIAPRVVSGLSFRALPASHPLCELSGKATQSPPLLAMSNGVREIWLHVPADVGMSWQTRKLIDKESFNLAMNVFFYATGKGEMLTLNPLSTPGDIPKASARWVTVGRLALGTHYDPEPGTWKRFAQTGASRFNLGVITETIKFDALNPAKFPIAHWVIADKEVALAQADIEKVAAYVEAGGLLLIEAAGGDPDFAAAAKNLIAKVFPKDKLDVIPRNDMLYNGAMENSAKVGEVKYRRSTATVRPVELSPRLSGISRGGRWGLVFSEDDLSAGILGISTWGISGYSIADAQKLAGTLILYRLKPMVPASTEPAPK
jgi:hypothetical protein